MSAALELQAYGFVVTVVDDQPAPGGRIFAAIESRVPHTAEDRSGADLVARFRDQGGTYIPSAEVWQIETGPRVFLSQAGSAHMVEPDFVVMATGAQERPMPFPGWELPGVMTIGSAQILLKVARQISDEPVWLAGSGPLLLLYAHQLIAAGGAVAGILDTTPPNTTSAAAPLLPAALKYGWRDLIRGVRWTIQMRSIATIRQIVSLSAEGAGRLQHVRYETRNGQSGMIDTNLLFIHDGIVPGLHGTLAAGCDHRWNVTQRCFEPIVDNFGRSSIEHIFIAGDGATIAGARAAMISGRLAGVGIAVATGAISAAAGEKAARPLRAALKAAARFRAFVDAKFPPADLAIPDNAIVCRCEEVTCGSIRTSLEGCSRLDTDGVKIATRAGMGPCQGRQCGLTVARLVAESRGGSFDGVAFPRIRPPLKPLTLGELATLDDMA